MHVRRVEIRVSKLLDHPSIVKLFEVFEDSKCVYMVMELCKDGDLEEHVTERKAFTKGFTRRLYTILIQALR